METTNGLNHWEKIYKRRKDRGVCVQCGAEKEDKSLTKCSNCLEKERETYRTKIEKMICGYCGKSTVGSPNKRVCISCRKDRVLYVRNRLRSMKETYVKFMGGKCEKCGIETNRYEIYDFHHINPNKKDIGINRLFRFSKNNMEKKIKEELLKCILLCSNCHRVVHCDIKNGLVDG